MDVERRGSLVECGEKDGFPVGMRVLVVDDDPVCLRVLEAMLRQCQYHVTTTNQAIKALALLRENKERFDLVISDVRMPDMDGFELLELIGLGMDLPVIMMSACGETKDVMKGITHGACDYLLKPVRMEELKIIWKHVIQRRKIDPKERKKSLDSVGGDQSEGFGEGMESLCDTDQIDKHYRKRKDQNLVDDDDGENNAHESEDLSTQKKARVVWSVELHKKFVEAVNQLGIDKAFPKRILDIMNVEGLTRENVASHLQKYRIYLKKCKAPDPCFLRANPIAGYGDYRTLVGSLRLPTSTLPPFPRSSVVDTPNNASTLIMDGLMPAMLDPSYARNVNSSIISFGNNLSNESILSGVPLQKGSHITRVSNIDPLGSSIFFGACSGTSNSNNAISLQGNPQETLASTEHTNKSSVRVDSVGIYPQRVNQNWLEGADAPSFKLNSLQMSDTFNHETLSIQENITCNFPLAGSLPNDHTDLPLKNAPSAENLRDACLDEGLLGNVVQNFAHVPEKTWGKQNEQRSLKGGNASLSSHFFSGRPSLPGQRADRVVQRPKITNPGQANPEAYFFQKGDESLEDLMAAMIKREQVEKILMDEDFGSDAYTLGSYV